MSSPSTKVKSLISRLYDIQAVKFGNFTLKSGIQSPIYFDLRVIVSFPELLETVADLIVECMSEKQIICDNVCGVPYTALPFATCVAVKKKLPMLIRRKEAKDYGTKKIVEGCFSTGDNCLIIEDVVTSGTSTLETAQVLRDVGLTVTKAIVFLDRGQGGSENLETNGITLHSICTIDDLLKMLLDDHKITNDTVGSVNLFLEQNSCIQVPVNITTKSGKFEVKRFSERAQFSQNVINRRLFSIMEKKQTNLAVAVDVVNSKRLLKFADILGPYICVLKTHIDILEDFQPSIISELKNLATKHEFLIMEDRKFSDIGKVVKLQYDSGIYHISNWADIVTVHSLPGPAVITALKEVGLPKERGCVLVAEMSSKDNLTNKDYVIASSKMATDHPDYVMGFVSQSRLLPDQTWIQMTPGVSLTASGDSMGQQYCSPAEAIKSRGADIIIVGRGVVEAEDPVCSVKEYLKASMDAYHESVKPL